MDKRELIAAFFDAVGIQNKQLQQEVLQYAKIRPVTRGTKLFAQGEEIHKIVIKVADGLVRSYYINEQGDEITECFDDARWGGLNPEFDFEYTWKSEVTIEALNDFKVIEIAMADLQKLVQKYPDVTPIAVRLMMNSSLFKQELKRILSESTAEEKVIWFNNRFPTLTGRVPEKHIASYLNMSPVTLSRIRTKLRESSTP